MRDYFKKNFYSIITILFWIVLFFITRVDLSNANKTIEDITGQKDAIEAKLNDSNTIIQNLNQTVTSLTNKISELESNAITTGNTVVSLENNIADLQSTIETQTAKLETQTEISTATTSEYAQKIQELNNLSRMREIELNNQISALKDELSKKEVELEQRSLQVVNNTVSVGTIQTQRSIEKDDSLTNLIEKLNAKLQDELKN